MDKELEKRAAAAEPKLIDEIGLPAFASRLQEHGVKWANDEEFAMLHAIGTQEYQRYMEAQQTKQAGEVNPFLKAAYEASVGLQQPQEDPDQAILVAASQCVAHDAGIKQAALDYFNYFNQLQADDA